jgi:hypothetical protein
MQYYSLLLPFGTGNKRALPVPPALVSGAVGAASNLTGQLVVNAGESTCERSTLNYGSIIGAGIGSFVGGFGGGMTQIGLLQYGASEGIAALGGGIGIGPSVYGS